jgi:hypothetical protein
MRARALLLVPLVALAALPTAPGAVPPPRATDGSVAESRLLQGKILVVAAGDIACAADPRESGSTCRYGDTADLVDGTRVSAVLTLGDNQYDEGRYADFLRYFDPTWGRAGRRLRPVPGNHEYAQDPSGNAAGYFEYFGARAEGRDGLGYYSFDLGACPDEPCWHVIALNSMLCFDDVGCTRPEDPSSPGPGNRMWTWLRRDLRRHPNDEYGCTLAYWHHPLFSFSSASGSSTAVRPLWKLLDAAGADVVLNGHSHNYQRWAPQTPTGAADNEGIREFVVGTGGASRYDIDAGPFPDRLQVAQADSFGVLRLALRAGGYRWEFVSIPGDPAFRDVSPNTAACH